MIYAVGLISVLTIIIMTITHATRLSIDTTRYASIMLTGLAVISAFIIMAWYSIRNNIDEMSGYLKTLTTVASTYCITCAIFSAMTYGSVKSAIAAHIARVMLGMAIGAIICRRLYKNQKE